MADEGLPQRFTRDFPKGTVLFREGDPGREMYVVQSGRVTIAKRVGDLEKVLATIGQGEFFGEMSILNNRPRSATATVDEDARLVVIDPKTFDAMIRTNAEIAIRMIKKLADRLAEADEQIENLLHRDAASRVVHWLAIEAERAGRPAEVQTLPVPPEELARRVGIDPGQIGEVMDRLERAKLAFRTPEGVRVEEVEKLRHFLEFLQMRAQYGDAA